MAREYVRIWSLKFFEQLHLTEQMWPVNTCESKITIMIEGVSRALRCGPWIRANPIWHQINGWCRVDDAPRRYVYPSGFCIGSRVQNSHKHLRFAPLAGAVASQSWCSCHLAWTDQQFTAAFFTSCQKEKSPLLHAFSRCLPSFRFGGLGESKKESRIWFQIRDFSFLLLRLCLVVLFLLN